MTPKSVKAVSGDTVCIISFSEAKVGLQAAIRCLQCGVDCIGDRRRAAAWIISLESRYTIFVYERQRRQVC